MNRRQSALIGAGILTAALWAMPGFGVVTIPLVYLNTLIHELCHALAATATGGMAEKIVLEPSGNGATFSAGGWGMVIASAGYVGAALIGSAMITFSAKPKGAKTVLAVLAAAIAVGMLLWVRGLVGVLSGLAWIALLVGASQKLKGPGLTFAAQFLGLQQALTSVIALYVLLQINVRSGIENDALIAQNMTGIPAIMWALLWVAVSGFGLVAGLRKAWGSSRSDGSPPEAQ